MFKAKYIQELNVVQNSYLWKKLWEKIGKLERQATERCCTGADENTLNVVVKSDKSSIPTTSNRFSVQYFQGRWKMSQDIKRLPEEIIEEINNLKE